MEARLPEPGKEGLLVCGLAVEHPAPRKVSFLSRKKTIGTPFESSERRDSDL